MRTSENLPLIFLILFRDTKNKPDFFFRTLDYTPILASRTTKLLRNFLQAVALYALDYNF